MPKCPCLRPEDPEVRVLDYRHSSLEHMPADVFMWERTLEELYVDANQIRDLPRELFYCHGLRKLSVADNEVTSVPPAIASLIHLQHLDISKNGIVDLPDSIKCCKYLSIIEASVNPLGKLPEGFTQLLNLTELYLNDTFLDYLPGSFGRISKLKILEVRENHLKTLPKSMGRLTALERLDIGNNEFTELPEVVGSLVSLLELWCDSNQISTLPPEIGHLKQLMFLDASKNRVECLPNEIDGCVNLGDLHLSTNLLQQLPENIGRLSNLTTLKVDDNRLTSLPFSIGGLVSLSELNISANDLEELPPSIGFLRHLRTMYADENFLYGIPPELGSCNGLTVLSFRSNNLMYIPDEVGRIPRLRVLNLSDNKIRCLPYSLTRLKELQALWLSENQTKPLIRLQPDIDIDTGQRMLTCYLLPQQPQDDNDDMYSEHGSFHPSLWEEERKQRQRIHFDFETAEEPGKLERCPTPYPKEMKHRIQHMRNLALKQLNVVNGPVRPGGPDPGGGGGDPQAGASGSGAGMGGKDTGPSAGKHGKESNREARDGGAKSSKQVSPLLAERHHLLRADKEKNTRDKIKMTQHRLSQESMDKSNSTGKENKRASGSDPGVREADVHLQLGSQHRPASQVNSTMSPTGGSGSMKRLDGAGGSTVVGLQQQQQKPGHQQSNLSLAAGSNPSLHHTSMSDSSQRLTVSDTSRTGSHAAAMGRGDLRVKSHPSSSSSSKQVGSLVYHHQPHHFYHARGPPRRSRGYESDTGYRSDTHSDVGYRSDTGFRIHRSGGGRADGYASDFEVMMRGRGGRNGGGHSAGGYGSDVEGYSGRRLYPNVYRPLSGHAPRHPGGGHHDYNAPYRHSQQPPSSSSHHPPSSSSNHPHQHPPSTRDSEPKAQGYSNAPYFRRTKIKNDELYEQQCAPAMPAHPVFPPPSTSSRSSRKDGGATVAGGGGGSGEGSAARPKAAEGDSKAGDNEEDELWKAQLYKASVKLQKTPSDKRKKLQQPVVEQAHNDSNDSVFVSPPPYQPAPPYSASKAAGVAMPSQAGSRASSTMDIPVMASSPKSARAQRVQDSPRSGPGTPRRPEMEHLQRPPGYGSQADVSGGVGAGVAGGVISPHTSRPTTLPLSSTTISGTPASSAKPGDVSAAGPRSGHVPDGRPQVLPPHSPHTPRAAHPPPTTSTSGGRTPGVDPHGLDYHSTPDKTGVPSTSMTTPNSSMPLTRYEKDVAVFKQMEPPSQVSSSTDSGYGHHIYERVPGHDGLQPSPSPRGPSPPSPHLATPRSGAHPLTGGSGSVRASPSRDSALYSRESTPGQDTTTPGTGPAGSSLPETRLGGPGPGSGSTPRKLDVFRVTITKNPGLGFSIAGGIGSPGNPFVPNDQGIFITKVQDQGPACTHLKRGDKILEVNGVDFTDIEHTDAVGVLRNSDQSVTLYIERSERVN